MRKVGKISLLAAAAIGIGLLSSGNVYATPTNIELDVTSGAATSGVISGTGSVFFSGTLNNWNVTFVAGATNSPTLNPFGIDITTLTVTCNSTCSSNPLVIQLSSTGFTQHVGAGGFVNSFSDTQFGAGTASQAAYDDPGNAFFATTTSIGTVTLTGTGANSVIGGGPAGPSAYSLTLVDTFTNNGSSVSFSADGAIGVPEPASLTLLGSALIGFGLVRRRRRRSV